MQQLISAGVDEVGRGPLAGPVIAAAVILNPAKPISGLKDSKKLSEKKRETLYEEICDSALSFAIGRAEVHEIDELNILYASLLAMQRAVEQLTLQPEIVRADGLHKPLLDLPVEAIVQGDQLVVEISAASIVAKVTRDREMVGYDAIYPGYEFGQHKGYPTKQHLQLLVEHGATPIHRRSFSPVRTILAAQQLAKVAESC